MFCKKFLIQWWLTPKFPQSQIDKVLMYKPDGFHNRINNFIRIWLIHPFKRRLAKYYLLVLKKNFGLKVIAITGSVGKTTAKEMMASVLKLKGETVYTYANIDPVYNIPTTILKCRPSTKFLILEMGVEYPGEMDFYIWLAKPDIGIVTSIYWTHTEFLRDIKNVINEKGKLIESLSEEGLAVLNADDKYSSSLSGKTKAKVVWFGLGKKADVKAANVEILSDFKTDFEIIFDRERTNIRLNVLGQQFVPLALAAAVVGLEVGLSLIEIKKGLEELKPIEHRMLPIKLKNGTIIIDDTYNANPLATFEAIKVLHRIGKNKRKILVLGDMCELGNYEKKGHEEVADFAVKMGIDKIFTLGDATKHTAAEVVRRGSAKEDVFNTNDKKILIKKLKETIRPKDVILIKGSRSVGLEEVVENFHA